MKVCDYCKIEVAGDFTYCPLCHNKLHGEPTENHWPSPEALKARSKVFKRQLLIIIPALIIFFIVELIFNLISITAGGLLILIWGIIGEITLYQFVRRHKNLSGIFTNIAVSVIIGLLLSSFWFPQLVGVIPIPLMVILLINFFITVFDKRRHVVVHFITFFLTGIISWIFALILTRYDLNHLWNICFVVSIATLALTLIIRGRDLISEVQKRFIF